MIVDFQKVGFLLTVFVSSIKHKLYIESVADSIMNILNFCLKQSYTYSSSWIENMRKKRVLICDDDRDFAKLLTMRLAKSGFEVILAADGVQVMQLARKKRPDCIVLDIYMPAGNAYATTRQLEQNSYTVAIPIILMSGQNVDFNQLHESYQNRFLKKPFDVNKLIDMIHQVTESDTGGLPEEIPIENK